MKVLRGLFISSVILGALGFCGNADAATDNVPEYVSQSSVVNVESDSSIPVRSVSKIVGNQYIQENFDLGGNHISTSGIDVSQATVTDENGDPVEISIKNLINENSEFTPFAIGGGSSSSNSFATTWKNVELWQNFGHGFHSFKADFTLLKQAYDRIDRIHSTSVRYAHGGSYESKVWRKNETSSLTAYAGIKGFPADSTGQQKTENLFLRVSNNSFRDSFN